MFSENSFYQDINQKIQKLVEYIRSDISTIRTGKASPSLVENIMVEAYGGTTKLRVAELSTITNEGPQGILVTPFDASTIKDIEKALFSSPLNLNPRVEGKNIHIKLPPLTEDQRKNFAKLIGQKIEEGKNKLRGIRDEARKRTKIEGEAKSITEDQKFRIEKEIDKIIQNSNSNLEEIKGKKEKELMEL